MKIRCIRLSAHDGTPQQISAWVTLGSIYDVLTVELDQDGDWLVRIIGDNGVEVTLHYLDDFEIVSHHLPSIWVAARSASGRFLLTPKAWLEDRFWERFYDREPEALEVFERELVVIQATP